MQALTVSLAAFSDISDKERVESVDSTMSAELVRIFEQKNEVEFDQQATSSSPLDNENSQAINSFCRFKIKIPNSNFENKKQNLFASTLLLKNESLSQEEMHHVAWALSTLQPKIQK